MANAVRFTPPTVGIVGAGQLARMMYQAAIGLGVPIHLLAEDANDSAARIGSRVKLGSPRSEDDLTRFAAECDVLTFDHELVDADVLTQLEQSGATVHPGADVVALAQNKATQRSTLRLLSFPVPAFREVDSLSGLLAFAEAHAWPVVLKAIRGGYDGRAVWILNDASAVAAVWREIDHLPGGLLVEAHIPIDREIAVLAARRPSGDVTVYPPVETIQRNGICRELLAPARVSTELRVEAERLAAALARTIGAVGMLAVELFVAGDRLIVNEIAARPHNSGHYTIEGCLTSQFEQHLRAILDWPLGSTKLVTPAVATVNLLGASDGSDPATRLDEALAVPGAHLHLYGKQARTGRKLGHVTALGDTIAGARQCARDAAERLGVAPLAEVST